MHEVSAGETQTQMRQAFALSQVSQSAFRRPKKNNRSLATKVGRCLNSRSGVIRHKKMAYVTRGG